jgi:hypothetical protein
VTKAFARSVLSLLQIYHVSLSEYARGGCYSEKRTNNHAERLQEMARLVLDRLYAEELPDKTRASYLAPIEFTTTSVEKSSRRG